jgi:CDGSH-type Zn-finger protein
VNSDSDIEGDRAVTITVCPDGPLLVRGPAALLDADGRALRRERATVALCRCGGTGIPPFCDGTHKKRKARRLKAK